MTWTIYLLADPQDPTTGYVGQTRCTMKHRLSNHRRSAKKDNTRRAQWLRAMYERSDEPSFTILAMAESQDEANALEREWIAAFNSRAGVSLTNTAPGGQGMFDAVAFGEIMRHALSRPEVRERRRQTSRASWLDPAIRARRISGQKETAAKPETKARKSRTSASVAKAFWADDAKRTVRVVGMKRAWTEERKEKMPALWANPEHRAKRLAAQKAAFARPEERARKSEATKKTRARPEVKALIAQNTARLWADPEHRAMRIAALKLGHAKRRKAG